MRLDHLLSREKAEAERRTPKPRSIDRITPVVKKASKKRNGTSTNVRKEIKLYLTARKKTLYRLQGSRSSEHAHLDNCTAKRKDSGKDQLKVTILLRLVSGSRTTRNQATKSTGWMPWHHTPKKDVASCEKLRGAASRHRSVDIRMGKPGRRRTCHRKMNP